MVLRFFNQKNLEGRIFFGFYGSLDIVIFCINYALKPCIQLLFLYYNLIFNLHEFIYFFTIFTLHTLCQYRLFWLSTLKPKNQKSIKNQKKNKFQIKKTF